MKALFKLLIPYVKRQKTIFMIVNLTAIATAVFQTLIPFQVSSLIDTVIVPRNLDQLVPGFLLLILYALLDWGGNMSLRVSATYFGQAIIRDLRQDLYETLQSQELEFYANENVGQIMSRTIGEIISFGNILRWGYRLFLLFVWLYLFSIISVWQISPYLSLILLILIPIIFGTIFYASSQNQGKFYQEKYVGGKLNNFIAENLAGIKTVKSFGREEEQIAKYVKKNNEYIDTMLKTYRVRAGLREGMVFILSLATMGLIIVGGAFIFNGIITAGQFVAFMLLVIQMGIPGRWMGYLGVLTFDANAATLRLNEVFDAPNPLLQSQGDLIMNEVKGKITFDNVDFSYPTGVPILQNINFTIEPGQQIVLLGPNGSGKSSLVNLIPRLFDPTKGRILIDDFDIKSFSLSSLRKQIGIVHQEAYLFTLSLHDNIAYGIPNATREDVIKVAKAAQIHEFICTLEEGYETIVGERGVTLSGGQRQRIAIARTLLKNPPIIIFDDSVSAVDPVTEGLIQASLQKLGENRTTIIISQRPSSLQYAERIIVMDKGFVVQDGTDDTLRSVPGIYQQFVETVQYQLKNIDWNESVARNTSTSSINPSKRGQN
ncbi:ABC transporter ATP-binding protein [Candidatus Lokiarchaeum ossiferum]|uniref:ABC transporter ATP-binding protein n=1 Tax=Candidatus Lokiarchaeum ossiferum TaxID=2951803 RepID=UPI00352FB953